MYGFLCGYSDTSDINYCPICGEKVSEYYGDGTAKCAECGKRFGVILDDEEENDNEGENDNG